MTAATFNARDNAVQPGWATYHRRLRGGWHRLVCLVRGHIWPAMPKEPNGYSPSNYARCGRCQNAGKWYVVGQHRYGSLSVEPDSPIEAKRKGFLA